MEFLLFRERLPVKVQSTPKRLGDVQYLANSCVFVDVAGPCQLAEECHFIQCRWRGTKVYLLMKGLFQLMPG